MTQPLFATFTVWDGLGWLGQALFTWRVVHQWWESERARRSVVPASFWWWSLAATVPLLAYLIHRQDVVFLTGVSVSGALCVRNLVLRRATVPDTARRRSPAGSIGLALLFVGLLTLVSVPTRELLDQPLAWLLVGFTGQAIWSGRFVLQWWVSERQGRSVLPASFFLLSIVGAVLLCAYAIHRVDGVMIAAYALNPIPYARNLVLLRRERLAIQARGARGADPEPPHG